jgi:hypothetical protein
MAISLDNLHEHVFEPYLASELRLLYPLFEEAQRSRVAHGERLRAIFQGRSSSTIEGEALDPDALLKAIGNSSGLARTVALASTAGANSMERSWFSFERRV